MSKFNVIQIEGIRGIILAAGAGVCLAAGFIAFPGLVVKALWNLVALKTGLLPLLNLFQGVLLWGIIFGTCYACSNKKRFIDFKSSSQLSHDEINHVMETMRLQRDAALMSYARKHMKEIEARLFEEDSKKETKDEEKLKNDLDN
jgi:biopolymer transport protein ExbB/TolQ